MFVYTKSSGSFFWIMHWAKICAKVSKIRFLDPWRLQRLTRLNSEPGSTNAGSATNQMLAIDLFSPDHNYSMASIYYQSLSYLVFIVPTPWWLSYLVYYFGLITT